MKRTPYRPTEEQQEDVGIERAKEAAAMGLDFNDDEWLEHEKEAEERDKEQSDAEEEERKRVMNRNLRKTNREGAKRILKLQEENAELKTTISQLQDMMAHKRHNSKQKLRKFWPTPCRRRRRRRSDEREEEDNDVVTTTMEVVTSVNSSREG